MWQQFLQQIQSGNIKTLARSISAVENEWPQYEQFLELLPQAATPVIGITGPPGAGKSTLADALIGEFVNRNKKVAVLCVDPSSPFNLGALLGDRIRMSEWYNNPNVFIRSLATRGSLGGLHPKIIEITDLIRAAPFDYIIIETVGVGQSEIEIAGLADVTVVVVVPEAGDEIQTMKAGLMEIANIFVVNKADRPEADIFVKNLQQMLAPAFKDDAEEVQIIKTAALQKTGIEQLLHSIEVYLQSNKRNKRKEWLLTEKAWHLIQNKRMNGLTKIYLKEELNAAMLSGSFNFYQFIQKYA